jgi:hypothetical protein
MLRNTILAALLAACCAGGCEFINPIGPITSIGIMWFEGEASKYYNTDQATTLKALKQALKELELTVTEERVDGKTTHVYVKEKGADKFHCKVIYVKPHTTKVYIRVNVMGDKPYAELVYRHIDSQPGVKTYNSVKTLNHDAQ